MNRIKQINEHIAKAALHRDQLHQLARDFAGLHDEPHGSDEADELMAVILDGEAYDDAMKRILSIKRHKRTRSK